jgi:hypothetical protein
VCGEIDVMERIQGIGGERRYDVLELIRRRLLVDW